jgi:hypothetical protein
MMLSNYVLVVKVAASTIQELVVLLVHRVGNVGVGRLRRSLVSDLHSQGLIESIASAMIALGPTDDDLVRLGRRGLSREYANRMALVIVHIGMNALDVVVHKSVRRELA